MLRFLPILWILQLSVMQKGIAQLTETDTLKFGYRLRATANWSSGNLRRFLSLSGADFSHVSSTTGFRSSNSYQYGVFNGNTTENDFVSRNFFYLFPRKRLYPYWMTWLQTSYLRRITWRYQAGPGVSFALSQKENNKLKISFTITAEDSKYRSNDFSADRYDGSFHIRTLRGTLRLLGQHQWIQRKLKWRYEAWWQPSFKQWENLRSYAETAIDWAIYRKLSLRVLFVYSYENPVVQQLKLTDTSLSAGVSWGNF